MNSVFNLSSGLFTKTVFLSDIFEDHQIISERVKWGRNCSKHNNPSYADNSNNFIFKMNKKEKLPSQSDLIFKKGIWLQPTDSNKNGNLKIPVKMGFKYFFGVLGPSFSEKYPFSENMDFSIKFFLDGREEISARFEGKENDDSRPSWDHNNVLDWGDIKIFFLNLQNTNTLELLITPNYGGVGDDAAFAAIGLAGLIPK